MKMQMTEEQKSEYFAEKCRHTEKVQSDQERIKVLESMLKKGRDDRRERIATAAMNAMIMVFNSGESGPFIAQASVGYADALLAELGKGET